jgi:hypothetical protein
VLKIDNKNAITYVKKRDVTILNVNKIFFFFAKHNFCWILYKKAVQKVIFQELYVCVCVWERERVGRKKGGGSEREGGERMILYKFAKFYFLLLFLSQITFERSNSLLWKTFINTFISSNPCKLFFVNL